MAGSRLWRSFFMVEISILERESSTRGEPLQDFGQEGKESTLDQRQERGTMASVALDADQARKIFRLYRGAKAAESGVRGYRKARDMLEKHAAQTDVLIDGEAFTRRVRERRVDPQDIRDIGRGIVNGAPSVYRFVARHIQKTREGKDA